MTKLNSLPNKMVQHVIVGGWGVALPYKPITNKTSKSSMRCLYLPSISWDPPAVLNVTARFYLYSM